MKKIFSIFGALLAGAMIFSCTTDTMDDIKFGTEITASVEALAEFAAENAEAQTLEVTANGDWVAVAPAWLEISPRSGAAGTTTVSVKALDNFELVADENGELKEEMGPKRSAKIQFAGEQDMKVAVDADGDGEQDVDEKGNPIWDTVSFSAEVAVSQNGDANKWDPAVPRPVTMKYFNEVATVGDGFTYILTGKITEVANTVYGNFYFEDETGTAYVYGLLTPDGKTQTQWAAAGLKVNDVITVYGVRGEYKGDPQMANATYMSHEVGEASPIVDATIAEFLAAEVGGTQYRISGVVTSIAKAEYGNVYIKDATGEVYVYGIGAKGEFETMGIEVGDIVTLISNRAVYNDVPQAKNSTLEKKIDVTAVASVADFLAKEEDGNYYMLTGTVGALKDGDLYGNFDIIDETGSVYVYGLLSGYKGEKKLFQELLSTTGMKAGDTLTLIGKRSSYNGADQVGSAFYFSHEAAGSTPELTPSAWTIVGSFNSWTVDAGTSMYVVDGYHVAYGFEYAAGVEFKFVENASWDVNRGGNGATAAINTAYGASQNGSNITVAAAGTYDIYLNEALDKYYIMEAGKTPADAEEPSTSETWGLMGDFENNNWATEIALVAEGDYLVAQDVVFANANNEGLAFKVRKNASWDTAYGADGSTYELGAEIALTGTANIFVNGVVGEKYDIYFDATNMKLWVMQDGKTPGEGGGDVVETYIPEQLYVIGSATDFGWNRGMKDAYLTKGENGIFTWKGNLKPVAEPTDGFKFLEKEDEWDLGYNRGADNNTLVRRTSGSDPDDKFTVESDGCYELTLDVVNLTISIVRVGDRVEEVYIPENLFLVGDGTEFGWDASGSNAAAWMTNNGNGIFTWTGKLSASGTFKFLEEVNNWELGYNRDGNAAEYWTLVRRIGGDDVQFQVEADGNYTITLDIPALKITCEPAGDVKAYTMTMSATAGVVSANVSGIPASWKESDSTWTATDDSGVDTITFTGNVYYSNSDTKNIIWYFNKGKAETHVSAAGFGTLKKVILYPNSDRKPMYFTCTTTAGDTVEAVEVADKNSATITWDFEAAGVTTDNFRLDFAVTTTNVECGKVVIEYEK